MNTEFIKSFGRGCMIAGGSIFTFGAGVTWTTNLVERKKAKAAHKLEMLKLEEESRKEILTAKRDREYAEKRQADIYADQLKNMDQKTFAKHHAEMIAKANQDILDQAERTVKDSEAAVVKARIECQDKIAEIEAECLKKISEAQDKAAEARKKYDDLDALFNDKDKVLRAKAELEELAEKKKATEALQRELNEKIGKLV